MEPVKLTPDNYTKCLCPVCPVQAGSVCIAAKRDAWKEMRLSVGKLLEEYASHPESYDQTFDEIEASELGRRLSFRAPTPPEMIELYCSIGKTDCEDLDTEQRCQCGDCAVWAKHGLDAYYYCRKA